MNDEPPQKKIKTEKIIKEVKNIYTLCKFCKVIIDINLYDKNKMMHCQCCHNIWNGEAQCGCCC
jgi:hypothetical protein